MFGFSIKYFSQAIEVSESRANFSTGSNNALITTIFNANVDDVIKAWKKTMKNYKNEKIKINDKEVFADNVLIKDWGNNPVDIYAMFVENNKQIKMNVAVDLGGVYLKSSEQKDKFEYMEAMVKNFAIEMTKEPLVENIKRQNKVLKDLEGDQKDLEKENSKLRSDIVSYQEQIKKAETALQKNDENQVKQKVLLEKQKQIIEQAEKDVESVN